ncbi:MAG: thiamine pyrophosphate-requiring protein [Pseudomonadales bacterium]|jgi:thiamine pyrophosphate-dependent acetolactate synthase large subunit-like protein|nr:thiamine pyrophosphate-requiring protein [Pseudomonadales bacterium]MDP6472536.1 thiamine pyrophosphate-requiring protein [Pseudomonadales bacterium]MDP6829017.1 thiamine pyrophosphate-requiring protein [Pseudomonadales bacterium]MDP6969912.1 thiamine pyrophosphate-requiring protein [Pseudomonadales bacterium]
MNGFDVVARCLKTEGVRWMACFPANPLIEAVARVGIRPIVFRQERGGINAADGFSRQTAGREIGVFAAQDGPGVENSFGGIAQAFGEAVPILFLPQGYAQGNQDIVPNFSARQNYAHITKLAISIDKVDQTSREIRRAFHAMRHGRPGPALVEMPRDVMQQETSADAVDYTATRTMTYAPSPGDVKDAVAALLAADNPVIWSGQGVLYARASDLLREFVDLVQIPVITTMQGKSTFPDDHPLALGSANRTAPKAVYHWLGTSDTVFAIGSGLTRTAFGQEIPDGKFLIHNTVSAEDINKDYRADVGLVGDAGLTLAMMIDEAKAQLGPEGRAPATELHRRIAAIKAQWLQEWSAVLNADDIPINPYRVVSEIDRNLDHVNSVVTHDAGSPRDQIMPFYRATVPHGYIGWGKTTHLGYGIPLVMGAKLADPDKFCMNFMGDLAFGHTGTEIETAVRAQIPITTIVINNRTMGGYDEKMPVAMQRFGAGNQGGDYAGMARAMGARGIHVDTTNEIAPAIQGARRANKEGDVVVIEIATRQFTSFSQYPGLLINPPE